MSKAALKHPIRQIANRLQSILGYLELEEHDKAIKAAQATVAELHRIKALKAAHETIAQLKNMEAAHAPLKLPKNGSVVVVPHGSRVVSHDDVTVDVDSDEVRVVGASNVRTGHGTHNPKTK